jgi:hypothetical protein
MRLRGVLYKLSGESFGNVGSSLGLKSALSEVTKLMDPVRV